MTNYTIELLKKEEMNILNHIDILNDNGVDENSSEKIGLRVMLEDVKHSIGILKEFKGNSVYDQKGKFKTQLEYENPTYNTTINLYSDVKGKDVNTFAETLMKELRKQQHYTGKGNI